MIPIKTYSHDALSDYLNREKLERDNRECEHVYGDRYCKLWTQLLIMVLNPWRELRR